MNKIKLKFNKFLKANDGFTLAELLVAISVFSIAISISTNMFINAIRAQRKALVAQNVVDNARYVMETISKEVRVARPSSLSSPLSNELSFTSNSENRKGNSIKFYFDDARGTVMFDDDTSDANVAQVITSAVNVKITSLEFTLNYVSGQPKVTVVLSAKSTSADPTIDSVINLQTTISPREISL